MADYHELLQKLVENVPADDLARRHAVYDRARAALSEQLKALEPPLSPAEIEREGRSLEDAIARVEGEVGSIPDAVPMARPAPPPRAAPGRQAAAVAIRRGGRPPRSRAVVLALVLLAAPIAVLAWLWRDRPAPDVAEPPPSQEAAAPAPSPEVKYGERVTGDPSQAGQPTRPPAARPADAPSAPIASSPPAPAPAEPAPAPVPAPTPDVAVAQRALMFEENPADPGNPILTTGRAVWRIDAVNGGPGQPLETIIRARVDLPDVPLSLALVIRRNLDSALPASHTIELNFSSPRGPDPSRVVRDVALPLMRPEEGIRGVAVVGLPVPVKDNVFLVGLSDLKADIDKNLELLIRRNWIELPVRFASGKKAALLFDKGLSGERVFLEAFRQWGQLPPDPPRP